MTKRTAYENFIQTLETESTKRLYTLGLDNFRDFCKVKSYEKLLTRGTNDNIANFIQSLKDIDNSPRTIRCYLTGVKHFFVMNDVTTINWDKVRKFIGKVQTKTHDELYRKEDIVKILEKCTERERIGFLLMLSAGLRIGSLCDLKVGHLKRIENVYRIKVYADTNSEYLTFCSPECAQAIDTYLEYRKRKGETITADSYLLVKLGDKPEPLQSISVASLLNKVLIDSGVRVESDTKFKRQKITRFHAFRKYFNTALARAGVKPALKEVLMGHYIGLESSYLRPTEDDLLAEYVKAIDYLTIGKERVLMRENDKLKIELESVPELRERIRRLESEKYDVVQELGKEQMDAEFDKETLMAQMAEMRREIDALKARK